MLGAFVLETGVDASRSALVLVCVAPPRHNLRLARGRSVTQRENASRSAAPRSAGTIASSLIFPLRFLSVIAGWLLKQKHPTDVGCFCFGNRRRHTLPGTCPRHTLCFSSPLATKCRARSPASNVFLFASLKCRGVRPAPRSAETIALLTHFHSAVRGCYALALPCFCRTKIMCCRV